MSTQATEPEVLPPEGAAANPTSALAAIPERDHLPPATLASIESGFAEAFRKAAVWRDKALSINVTSLDQTADMKMARVARLELKSIRVEADKTRKRLNEDSRRMVNASNGAYNILLAIVEPLEDHLDAQEKFAERLKEAERQNLIADRHASLAPYIAEGTPLPALDTLTPEQWDEYLANAKLLHEAKIAEAKRIEGERIAREQAEAAERERLRLENERLQKEAEEARAAAEKEAAARAEAEAKAKAEREAAERKATAEREAAAKKAAAELAASIAKAKAEREKLEAEARAEREAAAKAQAAIEAKAKAEREAAAEKARKAIEAANAAAAAARAEKEAAEAEARAEAAKRAKAEAAAKAKAEADAKAAAEAARKAEAAPDVDKLEAFAQAIRALKVPTLTSPAGQKAQDQIAEQTAKFAVWIENLAAKL